MANNPSNVNNHTTQNLNLIREATYNLEGSCPSDSRIWLAINKIRCDLSTNVRSFLWKLVHNAHKCSQYWLKIKKLQKSWNCQNCNTTESMQHIIFNCEANGCDHAWNIVKELYTMKHIKWPQGFNISSIMALPLKIKSPEGTPRPGATRFLLIAASEWAFLLWKLRCRRLLDGDERTRNNHSDPREVKNHLTAILNERLKRDRILTSTIGKDTKTKPYQQN